MSGEGGVADSPDRAIKGRQERSGLQQVMERMRATALRHDEGAFIGSEELLVGTLEASRATVRQAARLLEREGLIRVRRGPQGGYFAGRPSIDTVETAVGAYLQSVDLDVEEITRIASALWVEVARQAARRSSGWDHAKLAVLQSRLEGLDASAGFEAVLAVETLIRDTLVQLTDSKYIDLILRINIRYAIRIYSQALEGDGTPEHCAFVTQYRDIKLIELSAILRGDEAMAVTAAQHARNIWHDRLWLHVAS